MIPRPIQRALEATGLPWEVTMGGRHRKVMLAGRFVAILPSNLRGATRMNYRAERNVIAQIKRAAREHKEAA